MAEGGGKRDEDNPFSFKSFVKKKVASPSEEEKERENSRHPLDPHLPDISAQMPHESHNEGEISLSSTLTPLLIPIGNQPKCL